MYFKAMQAVVAFIISIITAFTAQIPETPCIPEFYELTNVNPNPIAESVKTQDITVMTYNLKISGDGLRAVEKRLPYIVDNIRNSSPDSFGVQEADKNWVELLAAEMTDYAHVEKYRDNGIDEGESSAIFYLKDKYDLIDSGHFWLSKTPDEPSTDWNAGCPRICTYAILKDKSTNFVYAHFNAHFDHVSVQARTESVALVSEKIAEIAPDIPVVLTGDFNFDEGSGDYTNMLKCGLKDTKYLADEYDDHATYHGYHVIYPSTKPIDYIMVNGYCSDVKSSKIQSSTEDHILASDHFPITVEMTLFNGGNK